MPCVGIMGGTFDPIHYGHLAAAQGAIHLLHLDHVLFVPNRQPPHKVGRSVTNADHRAAMVRLAIAGQPQFLFSDVELTREGPSYTIDTVRSLQERHSDWDLTLLVGMDSLIQMETWYDYRSLVGLVQLGVVTRPGSPIADAGQVLASLGVELASRVRILEVPGVAVSGTALRSLATKGYPLQFLVPDPVAVYIAEHGLYTWRDRR